MAPVDDRILVIAPLGRDARMIVDAFGSAGFPAEAFGGISALVDALRCGAAAIVVTEESLADFDRRLLVDALHDQLAWSDVPVIILTSADRSAEPSDVMLQEFAELGNVTLLERPLRIMTLITTAQSAVRARRRQYQVRDYVGEREGLERQLRAWALDFEGANRAKDEFLAMLSHELRNPLHAIASAASILDQANAMQAARARDVIRRQIHHLGGVVDDLLDIGRITTGKIQLQSRLLDLAALVTRVVDQHDVERRAPTHTVKVDAVPVWVNGDETRLEQITVNLLTNAVKYTPEGGEIRVAVGPEGDVAIFRIADTGVGIAHDRLSRIFELFFQAEQALDRRAGGLGIGLTLVKQLVTLHGDSVTAESEGIDRGSVFTVRLSRIAPASATSDPAESPLTARRVLIIEDNADSREMLCLMLELAGHQAFVAEDGPRGLDAVAAVRPHAVLVDIGLPGLDGYEVARRLRQLSGGHALALVALTGCGRPEDKERSRESGYDYHLVKPVDPIALRRMLADLGEA
jgi:signal transduction histidine kinase